MTKLKGYRCDICNQTLIDNEPYSKFTMRLIPSEKDLDVMGKEDCVYIDCCCSNCESTFLAGWDMFRVSCSAGYDFLVTGGDGP